MESRFLDPLGRLRPLGDALAGMFGVRRPLAATLRGFLATQDPIELPRVLPLVLSSERAVAASAAAAIGEYLGERAPRELVVLDEALRAAYRWSSDSPWQHLRPRDIRRVAAGQHSAAVLGLASFHPNGYVREAAVEALSEIRTGRELPFLLVRVNDWVGGVRDAAYAAVSERLVPAYAPHLIDALWLIARLEHCGRADHARLLGDASRLLATAEARPALVDGTTSGDPWLRRMCYRMLFAGEWNDMPGIVRRALGDADPIIRIRGAERAAEVFDAAALPEVLELMSRDPFMPVRREALRSWVQRFPAAAGERLRNALLDPHPAVRESARFHLREQGETDFREFYHQHLEAAAGPVLRVAVDGLGETGRAGDAERIRPYLAHGSARLREAAISALSRLAAAAFTQQFIRALEDSSPAVSRAARRALSAPGTRLDGDRLWEIWERSPDAHVRINVLSLIAQLGKWEGASWLIRACAARDERVERSARQHLARWIDRFNRSHAQPARAQLERIRRALDESPPGLFTENTERMLRFLTRGFDA